MKKIMVDSNELKERLQTLRDKLENATGVSPLERDFLTSLIAEIIAMSGAEEPSEDDTERGFRELLEQKSTVYEVDHPEISYLVRQVLDMLAKMGI
ncbi:MAG: DUF4404 family protein [Porticoccaceae bacterium]|jgi:hypothetical protein|nr:DUF4404 family protein [Porticoccaceae bacterium]